jgi:hypothetical protein
MRHVLVTTVLLATASLSVSAQTRRIAEVGQRVRVTALDGSRGVGTIRRLTEDSLVVFSPESLRRYDFELRDVDIIEISIRRERRFLRSAGLVIGAAVVAGAAVGAVTYAPCVPKQFLDCLFAPTSRGEAAALGGVLLGALGIPVGVIVGLRKEHDVWETAAPEREVGFSVGPRGGSSVRLVIAIPMG